jgi:single-stranded-DNA-specific exonuclease
LQWVHETDPNIIVKFGGHKGAAGVTIYKKDFDRFAELFEQAIQAKLAGQYVGPIIHSDGAIDLPINNQLLDMLNQLAPFGREFEQPVFEIEANILSTRPVGQDGVHWQLSVQCAKQNVYSAVWFNVPEKMSLAELVTGTKVRLIFSVSENNFQGTRRVQLLVQHLDIMN